MAPAEEESRGIVMVATGERYLEMAYDAVASIREAMPGVPVDLFTDLDVEDGAFDRVVRLEKADYRAKIDCMNQSRFDRTLYLDADIRLLLPVWDVFALLDRFDIAVAHDQTRVQDMTLRTRSVPVPEAYPQFNCGVIAWRRSEGTEAFFRAWRARCDTLGLKRDQFAFREEAWLSDLRIATLPPEYNVMNLRLILAWLPKNACPRLIHSPRLHWHLSQSTGLKRLRRRKIRSLAALLGPVYLWRLNRQIGFRKSILAGIERGRSRRGGSKTG